MKMLAIHSVPRSGSTWLGSIFDSHPNVLYKYQPLFSYALKGFLNENSDNKQIQLFFETLGKTSDDFMDQVDARKKGIVPEFIKDSITTVVYKEVRYHHIIENMMLQSPDIKVVGLIRNPLATIHSWLNAPREFRKDLGWKVENEWKSAPSKNLNKKEEFNGYYKWKEVAIIFEKLKAFYPDRFFLVVYNDLITDPINTTENLFSFAGLEWNSQTENFIRDSTSKQVSDAYGVYKVKVNDDDWVEKLPSYIINEVTQDLKGTILEKYLL